MMSRRVHLRMSEPKGHQQILCPSVALDLTFAVRTRGATEANVKSATLASRAKDKKHTSKVTTGSLGNAGIPCASGFNGLLRALPGEPGFLATIPSAMRSIVTRLISASGYQDHTTSPSALRVLVSHGNPSIASRIQRW